MDGPPNLIDVVGLGVIVAGFFYSPATAAVIGPYIVIIMASVVGASFAVARRERTTRAGAVLYFVRSSGIAILLTGMIASVLAAHYQGVNERILIAPVALLLGSVGDDWGKVLRRLQSFVFSLLDLMRKDEK